MFWSVPAAATDGKLYTLTDILYNRNMKNIFNIKHVLKYLLVLLIFSACRKEDNSLTNTLLLEQSKELILANQRELSSLMSAIAEINLNEKKATSVEYEKISNLYDELKKFNLSIQNANRIEVIELINIQNAKFKNDKIFKVPVFKFQPVKVEELDQLNDEILKIYAASKISRFYVDSAGYIFTHRQYGRESL